MLFSNLEHFKSFFPDFFASSDEELFMPHSTEITNRELNTDDNILSQSKFQGGFNQEKGMWEYPSLTIHKPKEMMDEFLVNCTKERNDYTHSTKIDTTTGLYQTFHLKASMITKEKIEIKCQCGTSYHKEGIYKDRGTLYTQTGPVNIKYYDTVCSRGICTIPYTKGAEEKAIFMYLTATTAGDEIGWDFVTAVITAKSSFSAFCKEMTRKYQTTNTKAGPFMSPNTFIKCFFGWIASFKIDFHQEIDPRCHYNPKMLACDGTHIGVSVRNMCLNPAVTTNDDKNTILKSIHKRNDRLILQDKTHRKHMCYLARKFLKKLKSTDVLHIEVEEEKMTQLLNYAHETCFSAFYEILIVFAHKLVHNDMLHVIGRLLLMLSGDSAMSSFAPFQSHDLLLSMCENASQGIVLQNQVEEMKTDCIELTQLLVIGNSRNCTTLCVNFIRGLVGKIKEVHQNNRAPPPIAEIPGSYNPSTGTAYYFTESGNQLCRMPKYEVHAGDKDKNALFDDRPEVDDPCNKFFPKVSKGGFGYMFLWFCPIHGHCYGFHLISGCEGRKDPFASLYKYCNEMPDHIYYDFACQLSEYFLNREPELLKNTRFWHDLFHFVGHVCGINFKSGRVLGLKGVNTEICEQVNSFLQCIKYTGSHLSQEHFTFFVQFFLYLMNKGKTTTFRGQAAITVVGQM